MNKRIKQNKAISSNAWLEGEYSRIMTAAVVNRRFCDMLLSNPEKAISNGYAGEIFHLGSEEKKHLAAIRATSLADFARQLTQVQIGMLGCAAD